MYKATGTEDVDVLQTLRGIRVHLLLPEAQRVSPTKYLRSTTLQGRQSQNNDFIMQLHVVCGRLQVDAGRHPRWGIVLGEACMPMHGSHATFLAGSWKGRSRPWQWADTGGPSTL